jgi:hypothetical protein
MLREEQVNKCDAFFAKSFMSGGIVRRPSTSPVAGITHLM